MTVAVCKSKQENS